MNKKMKKLLYTASGLALLLSALAPMARVFAEGDMQNPESVNSSTIFHTSQTQEDYPEASSEATVIYSTGAEEVPYQESSLPKEPVYTAEEPPEIKIPTTETINSEPATVEYPPVEPSTEESVVYSTDSTIEEIMESTTQYPEVVEPVPSERLNGTFGEIGLDEAALRAKVAAVEFARDNRSLYTPESWIPFFETDGPGGWNSAGDAILGVYEALAITDWPSWDYAKEYFDRQVYRMDRILNSLVLAQSPELPDTSLLEEAIQRGKDASGSDNWTEESKKVLDSAVTDGENALGRIIDGEDISQQEYIDAINNAINNLKKEVEESSETSTEESSTEESSSSGSETSSENESSETEESSSIEEGSSSESESSTGESSSTEESSGPEESSSDSGSSETEDSSSSEESDSSESEESSSSESESSTEESSTVTESSGQENSTTEESSSSESEISSENESSETEEESSPGSEPSTDENSSEVKESSETSGKEESSREESPKVTPPVIKDGGGATSGTEGKEGPSKNKNSSAKPDTPSLKNPEEAKTSEPHTPYTDATSLAKTGFSSSENDTSSNPWIIAGLVFVFFGIVVLCKSRPKKYE